MSTYMSGRIIAVDQRRIGRRLAADHAAGATTLTLNSAQPFDEDGGSLQLNDQVIQYTAVNDETGEVTLATQLGEDAEEGTRVLVYDVMYQRPAVVMTAQVELDEEDDQDEPIEATVAHHLQKDITPGLRGGANPAEPVLLDFDEDDDEWRVVDILGLDGRVGTGSRYEADDSYVLSAADIVAGTATATLSFEPLPESVSAKWGPLAQEPTEYTVNYGEKTVIWPLDGFEQVGDRLWFHYEYLLGIPNSQAVTIQLVANDHADQLRLVCVLPDGTRYEVPGVNTPGAGPVQEFGRFVIDDMVLEFTNQTIGVTVTYPSPAYMRRNEISGVDERGSYAGYRYEIEDTGPSGDGDYNDIVLDVKGY